MAIKLNVFLENTYIDSLVSTNAEVRLHSVNTSLTQKSSVELYMKRLCNSSTGIYPSMVAQAINQKLREKLTITFLLQLLCTTLTLILIYQELETFTVSRPTMSSVEQRAMDKNSFPEVTVCLDPSISKDQAQRNGYDITVYYKGMQNTNTSFVGWNGVDEHMNSIDILEDILTLNPEMDLIWAYFTTVLRDQTGFVNVNVTYTKAVYPVGKCALLNIKGIQLRDIETVGLGVNSSFVPKHESSVNINLRDPVNSIQIFPEGFHMQGSPISIRLRSSTFQPSSYYKYVYKIKLSQSYHVLDDPHFDCTEYNRNFTYNDCVQDEMESMFEQLLGCVPPLLAKNSMNMCNRVFNLTSEEGTYISHLLYRIYSVGFTNHSCKTPCTRTTYTTELVSKTPASLDFILLAFDPTVSVTRTSFSIGPQTLVTRLGGSVSSGRTLLWGLAALVTLVAGVYRAGGRAG